MMVMVGLQQVEEEKQRQEDVVYGVENGKKNEGLWPWVALIYNQRKY